MIVGADLILQMLMTGKNCTRNVPEKRSKDIKDANRFSMDQNAFHLCFIVPLNTESINYTSPFSTAQL